MNPGKLVGALLVAVTATGVRRELRGGLRRVVEAYCAGFAIWTLYQATLSSIDVLALSVIYLSGVLSLVFLLVGAGRQSDPCTPSVADFVLTAAALACGIFFISQIEQVSARISLFDPLTWQQKLFASVVILLVLEGTRRTVGAGLLSVVLATMAYNLFGDRLTGMLRHGTISLEHFLDINVFTADGLFGVPVRVAATYAFVFVLFGTLIERTGGAKFFFDVAAILSGRRAGGPAKIAVVSSGLFGAVSGSPSSDVMTTGAVTIPAMKRLGYTTTLAGAIEVAASTGGSLLPPVMGSAAFIMAEFTGISYIDIATAALVPALLFYVGVMAQVHLRSCSLGLAAHSPGQAPSLREALAPWYVYAPPVAVMVGVLFEGYSPTYAGCAGALALIATSQLRREGRLTPAKLYAVLSEAMSRMIPVSAACAAAGLVIGGITMTGLAQKFAHLILAFGSDNLLAALLLGSLVTLILGLGMPTSSAYILAAVLVGPALVNTLGLPLMSAHMFLFYFAVVSAMTPPVAVAAYAAAAIADGHPMHIGAKAVTLSIAAFIVPFAFVYNTGLLLEGSVSAIACSVLLALTAVLFIAVAIEGFLKRSVALWLRLGLGSSGIMLLQPPTWWSMVWAAAGVALVALHLGMKEASLRKTSSGEPRQRPGTEASDS